MNRNFGWNATPVVLVLLAGMLAPACSSGDSSSPELESPGDACDGSKPLVCGSLAQGGTRKDVVLACKNGKFESLLDCKPTGNGLTNRCFPGGSNTVVDCFDEPSAGKVTRCQTSGAGTSVTYACTVGTR